VISRPMLAATAEPEQLDGLGYPMIASDKLDGIRCLVHPELGPVTRKFKPIPNTHIRSILSLAPDGLDGEIMCYGPNGQHYDFNAVQSLVMTESGLPRFLYMVFDWFGAPDAPYVKRLQHLRTLALPAVVCKLHQRVVRDATQARLECAKSLEKGHEGLILRHPYWKYKEGRSTLREQGMVKYKPFADAEGKIVGFEERLHNGNEATTDELGYTKRSSHKANYHGLDTLGALVLQTEWGILKVGGGPGLDDRLRKSLWGRRHGLLGCTVTFKYQKHGMLERPRFPQFVGIRRD
jgi:DNA ligase-1